MKRSTDEGMERMDENSKNPMLDQSTQKNEMETSGHKRKYHTKTLRQDEDDNERENTEPKRRQNEI